MRILSPVNLIDAWTSTATAAGTTTMSVTDNYQQFWTGTSTQTVKLPTTGVSVGKAWWIVNNSTGLVTVQSSGANTILILAAGTSAIFTAIVDTPTTAANWNYIYSGINIQTGKKLSVNGSFTLTGTDGQTYTLPTTSATLARTDAANTFTGVQTMTSPVFTTPVLGTPSSGNLANCTFPTLNQSTTGSAATLTTPRAINGVNFDGSAAITVTAAAGTLTGTTLASNVVSSSLTSFGASIALGTPASGTLTNCTFPTLNQNTTGSAAKVSISGQTGLLSFSGLTSTDRIKTVRDAADTILELGGSYTPTGTWTNLTLVTPALGTPASGNLTNCTFPTLNQNTTGSAATLTTARTIDGVSFNGSANIKLPPSKSDLDSVMTVNTSDPSNDWDCVVRCACTEDGTQTILHHSDSAVGYVKRVDAAWAAGTNQGGLDTGAVANTWYSCYVIQRSDTGAVDFLFSTGISAPNVMPTNYDRYRRIGTFRRVGGVNQGWIQSGDNFDLITPICDNGASYAVTTSRTLATLSSIPAMFVTGLTAKLNIFGASSASVGIIICNPSQPDVAPTITATAPGCNFRVFTNTAAGGVYYIQPDIASQQIAIRASLAGCSLFIFTQGWIDPRGRFDS